MFPQLNLHYWKTDSPALQVPEAILIQTLEKGTQGLAQRRKEEYKLWELSKKYVLFFLEKKNQNVSYVFLIPNNIYFLQTLELTVNRLSEQHLPFRDPIKWL